MGLVHNGAGLMAVRFFLGLAEAGLFPGIGYFLSCWYRRDEFGVRMAIFFSGAALAGSFGGLLAAAIALMDGVGGKAGWCWIFILEGLATVLIGIACFWMVQDFPDKATFLSPDDKKRVVRRLAQDKQASAENEDFDMVYFWSSMKDWKTWLYAVIYMGADMPLYGFSLFVPTIIEELVSPPNSLVTCSWLTSARVCHSLPSEVARTNNPGYTSVKAQLLSVPPYAAAAVITVSIGFLADHTRQRGITNMAVSVIGMTGYALLIGAEGPGARYAGVFLAAMGIYPCVSNTIAWCSNNTEGRLLLPVQFSRRLLTSTGVYKRGVTLGVVIGWGNLNGIVASNVYRGGDAPQFYPGHGVMLGYLVVCLFGGSLIQYILLIVENRKREQGKRDHWVEGLSSQQLAQRGDERPDFIYTL